ncbi:MAG: hypothetical protein R3338_08385 [Thermoanaerobaculia bacterium]|nr:hypothetical protein [Thermoanaerobaculia bacterium]
MKSGRVILIVVVLLASLQQRAEGAECTADRFYQTRGYPADIEVSGDELWIADGAGLARVDVSAPTDPILLFSTFEATASRAIARVSDHEVALLTDERIVLYDLLGTMPLVAGGVSSDADDLHTFVEGVVAVGKQLVLARVTGSGLEEERSVVLNSEPRASGVVGNLLLVSVPDVGTTIFDETLVRRGRIPVEARKIAGNGNIAFLARSGGGIASADLSDPDNPQILDQTSASVAAREIVLGGEMIVASDGEGKVHLIDVARPDEMELIATSETDADVMATRGRYLYEYSFTRDRFGTRFEDGPYLSIRDLESPNLDLVGSLGISTGPLRGIATDGSTAWIADPPFVRAISLSTGSEIWRMELEEPFDQLRFENGYLITYGATWIHLIEPRSEEGRLLGKWPTLGVSGGGVTFSGPWLIEANRASGFHVLDISALPEIVQRGGLINDGRGQWMDVVGIPGAVYGVVNTGVKVVSLGSDPSAVEVVNFLPFGRTIDVEIVEVEGNVFLVVLDNETLRVHDLAIPLQPMEISSVEVPPGEQLAVSGSTVWILDVEARAVAVSLDDPAAPVVTRVVEGMREGLAVAAAGDVVVGADRWAMWGAALTPVEELPPPSLERQLGRDEVELSWSTPPVHATELQLALDEQFGSVEESWTSADEKATIERRSSPAWVRARFVSDCGSGEWSASVRIAPEERTRGRIVTRP